MKNKKLAIILLIAVLIIGIGSITYAYFAIDQTNTSSTLTVETGALRLVLEDGTDEHGVISGPIDANHTSYTAYLSITNEGPKDVFAKLYFKGLTNNFSDDLVYTLERIESLPSNNVEPTVLKTIVDKEPVPSSTNSSNINLVDGLYIKMGTLTGNNLTPNTQYYRVTVEYLYNDTEDQSDDLGKSFYTGFTISETDKTDDEIKPNEPKLVTNLIPVIYNETTNKWVMSNTNEGIWYDYDNQKWANAVTVVENKHGTYNVGDTIEMSDILGMFVWIPRFEYKYTNLGTQYAGGTKEQPGEISIKFLRNTDTYEENDDYIIHPVFRDGSKSYTNNAGTFSAWQLGGWDKELTGFWFGKFETSSENATSTNNSSDIYPIIKPNVLSRRYQTISNQYLTSKQLSIYHSISLDSHMVKADEWSAVAYLSQSKYGKYGNNNYIGVNKEVYHNNSGSLPYAEIYTGKSMGMIAGATGNSWSKNGTYSYNENLNGTGASTTGTIYGIYDMVGGSWEYIMATYDNTIGQSNFNSLPVHKYYNNYSPSVDNVLCSNTLCYGHVTSEINRWYLDGKTIKDSSSPWFTFGGYFEYGKSYEQGIFIFDSFGGQAINNTSFRIALT